MDEILIYDIIGQDFFGAGVIAKDIKAQLDGYKDSEEILVRINSPGGDVFEGVTIFNLLKEHSAKITVKVEGYAASIASIVAMAGDHVEIAANAMFMIHNPYVFALGDSKELRKTADVLDKIKDSLIGTYQTKASIDDKKLSNLMDDETWFSADEAKELGFADSIAGESEKITDLSAYRWINKAPSVSEPKPQVSVDGLTRSLSIATARAEIAEARASLK